jgi:hypothetical protein
MAYVSQYVIFESTKLKGKRSNVNFYISISDQAQIVSIIFGDSEYSDVCKLQCVDTARRGGRRLWLSWHHLCCLFFLTTYTFISWHISERSEWIYHDLCDWLIAPFTWIRVSSGDYMYTCVEILPNKELKGMSSLLLVMYWHLMCYRYISWLNIEQEITTFF